MAGASLSCPCCCLELEPTSQLLFSCPNSKPGEQHILRRTLNKPARIHASQNPFERYKEFFFSYHLSENQAESLNTSFSSKVSRIQTSFNEIFGQGLEITPLALEPELARALDFQGKLWVKDETGQLGGSHKIRHMMGTMLYLESADTGSPKKPLAIYSCGNAALAASVVARAGGYNLHVFLPTDVLPEVEAQIHANQANAVKCPRDPKTPGDPAYKAFLEAVQDGALPFSCSGPDNWSNIEGGETLILEAWEQMGQTYPDHIFVQVGGGALASSCIQGIMETAPPNKWPQVFVIQTESCFPLARTYFTLLKSLAQAWNMPMSLEDDRPASILRYANEQRPEYERMAQRIKACFPGPEVQKILHEATCSNRWNRVWENVPSSVAHGILDDFTYDWYAIIRGLFATGGWPILVSETDLHHAHQLAREHTNIPVDPTGSSGLAGFVKFCRNNPQPDSALVLFTGRQRAGS